MESSLLFFLVGLSIFGGTHLTKSENETVQFLVYFGIGIVSGLILGLFISPPWPPSVQIPRGGVPVVTGLAGIILYAAEKKKLLTRPGLQYFATILLGLLIAGLSYGLLMIYQSLSNIEYRSPEEKIYIILVFLLIGFLTVFGYTFPERWFKQRKLRKNIE